MSLEQELRDPRTWTAVREIVGPYLVDQILKLLPYERMGPVRGYDTERRALVELDGPGRELFSVPIGEHTPPVGQMVCLRFVPARDGLGQEDAYISHWVGTEIPDNSAAIASQAATAAAAAVAPKPVSLVAVPGSFPVIGTLAIKGDTANRVVIGLDPTGDAPIELWGDGTSETGWDVRRERIGPKTMRYSDASAARIALLNGPSTIHDDGNHGASGNPHPQYATAAALGTLTGATENIIAQGVLTTSARTTPGNQEASLVVPTGLTYRPWVKGMWEGDDGRSHSLGPVFNAAGQVVDGFALATEVVETNKTKVTATMSTSRPAGRGPATFHWQLTDRNAGG